MITNENGLPYGVFCGPRTGKAVLVFGNYAEITFRSVSGFFEQNRGFLISFTTVSLGKCNITRYLSYGFLIT